MSENRSVLLLLQLDWHTHHGLLVVGVAGITDAAIATYADAVVALSAVEEAN